MALVGLNVPQMKVAVVVEQLEFAAVQMVWIFYTTRPVAHVFLLPQILLETTSLPQT